MRKVCTIYWDEANCLHHTLVCEVEESGAHTVIHSHIDSQGSEKGWTKEWHLQSAVRYFGADNVRFYDIKEVKV
jgi:hypothetical protein